MMIHTSKPNISATKYRVTLPMDLRIKLSISCTCRDFTVTYDFLPI